MAPVWAAKLFGGEEQHPAAPPPVTHPQVFGQLTSGWGNHGAGEEETGFLKPVEIGCERFAIFDDCIFPKRSGELPFDKRMAAGR